MDYQVITNKYYSEDNELRHILLVHSCAIADKAPAIADCHPELSLDRQFIEEAAMLHDIGIVRCNASGIQCFDTEPYICHDRIDAEMLRAGSFPRHARVCERHIGAGITRSQIVAQKLPLPQQDFPPETMEEKVICYTGKFFSKSHLDEEKTIEQAIASLFKFGERDVVRFREWVKMF